MPRRDENDSIAVMVCYFGKLPWYFSYFVHSCKYNPTIDFIIITDCIERKVCLPKNVKMTHMTLAEFRALARRKLALDVNISSAYKVCDFKPTYGKLFDDILKGYAFWAHGDLDVIFGDIRAFITSSVMSAYDIISVRHDFLTGQFLLFRNIQKLNDLFMLSKDYELVLTSDKHYCFDETNFAWKDFSMGKPYSEISTEVESMTHLAKRMEEANYLKVHFDFLIVEGTPGRLKWENGKLFYRNRFEVLLYHLVLFKKHCVKPKVPFEIRDKFQISPRTIYR